MAKVSFLLWLVCDGGTVGFDNPVPADAVC